MATIIKMHEKFENTPPVDVGTLYRADAHAVGKLFNNAGFLSALQDEGFYEDLLCKFTNFDKIPSPTDELVTHRPAVA
jgi:hypothetical protein